MRRQDEDLALFALRAATGSCGSSMVVDEEIFQVFMAAVLAAACRWVDWRGGGASDVV